MCSCTRSNIFGEIAYEEGVAIIDKRNKLKINAAPQTRIRDMPRGHEGRLPASFTTLSHLKLTDAIRNLAGDSEMFSHSIVMKLRLN